MRHHTESRIERIAALGGLALALLIVGPALACPPDVDGDGDIGPEDLTAVLLAWGPCDDDCPEDVNGDGEVGWMDLAFISASWGPCPAEPGDVELFDEVVAVDATNAPAQARGLVVTHLYATGPDVEAGHELIMVADAWVTTIGHGDTGFFQHAGGGAFPPASEDLPAQPWLCHDTFVTMGTLVDTEALLMVDEDTDLDADPMVASWAVTPTSDRAAVHIGDLTGTPGQYGVLIAQITMPMDAAVVGYEGSATLYTSILDGGPIQGADVSFACAISPPSVDCPPDVNGDGAIDGGDITALILDWGFHVNADTDLNGDTFVDEIDVAYLNESWGDCPSDLPGDLELFDEVRVVDLGDPLDEGVIVTHVYATGEAVGAGDALLLAGLSDVQATDDTEFFQVHEDFGGGDLPPSSVDVAIFPPLALDTFVTIGSLIDDTETALAPGFSMSDTAIGGGWFIGAAEQREAAWVSAIDAYGVLVAQITMTTDSDPAPGYAGTLTLYTSTADGGALAGNEAAFSFESTPPTEPADVNGDGAVDVQDLVMVISAWGTPGPGDINGDGIVDVQDLMQVILNWT